MEHLKQTFRRCKAENRVCPSAHHATIRRKKSPTMSLLDDGGVQLGTSGAVWLVVMSLRHTTGHSQM